MKKTIIAVFAVLAVAASAGAQETGWNFDGRGAAALPVPKLERVRTEGDIQPDISDSIIPQRIVVLENMDRAQFRKMLEKAVRRNNTKSVECYLTGDITVGNMICGSECCVDSEIGSASADCHMIGPCIAAPVPDKTDAGSKRRSGWRKAGEKISKKDCLAESEARHEECEFKSVEQFRSCEKGCEAGSGGNGSTGADAVTSCGDKCQNDYFMRADGCYNSFEFYNQVCDSLPDQAGRSGGQGLK